MLFSSMLSNTGLELAVCFVLEGQRAKGNCFFLLLLARSALSPLSWSLSPSFSTQKPYKKTKIKIKLKSKHTDDHLSPSAVSPQSLLFKLNSIINSVFNMKQWTHPCQILTFTWLQHSLSAFH